MKYYLILTLCWLLSGCDRPSDFQPQFDHTGKEIVTKTLVFESSDALVAELKRRGIKVDLTTKKSTESTSLAGQYILTKEGDVIVCTIFLVAPKIRKTDDDFTMTAGHELEHCLYGNYHG
jgi:hypothetical protein